MRVGTMIFAIVAGLLVGVIVTLGVIRIVEAPQAPSARGLNEIAANGNVQGRLYPGDGTKESKLVETENERVVYVRTVASAAEYSRDGGVTEPYRLRTGPTYTLMLPARKAAYTVKDLRAFAPDTFTRQPDGSFLLSESIVVLEGARLSLASENGLDIKLASSPESFVSIVTIGGDFSVTGAGGAPLTITSWDAAANAPDTETADGRSYIRVIGGNGSLEHAQLSDLGFWSGNTGGLSFTGAESVIDFDEFSEGGATQEKVAGAEMLKAGELGDVSPGQDYSFVSASISDVRATGNAFGIFVAGAEGVSVTDTTVEKSLVDGLVFHRYVTESSVTGVQAIDNAVDGIALSRSSTSNTFSDVTARNNGRNGLTLDGQPLADGPSAVGTPVESYGDNSVARSRFVDNGRYGVEVNGGSDIAVTRSRFTSNEMGVVVANAAERVTVSRNTFVDQSRQSIAIREDVAEATVASNRIEGGDTGIYVRNAEADVANNTLTAIKSHGISLVGDARSVSVVSNDIAGSGSTALWTKQAFGGRVDDNNVSDWNPAPTFDTVVSAVVQPLTLVWIGLAIAVMLTAFTPRRRSALGVRHPYQERIPLSAYSKGVVSRESIGDRA